MINYSKLFRLLQNIDRQFEQAEFGVSPPAIDSAPLSASGSSRLGGGIEEDTNPAGEVLTCNQCVDKWKESYEKESKLIDDACKKNFKNCLKGTLCKCSKIGAAALDPPTPVPNEEFNLWCSGSKECPETAGQFFHLGPFDDLKACRDAMKTTPKVKNFNFTAKACCEKKWAEKNKGKEDNCYNEMVDLEEFVERSFKKCLESASAAYGDCPGGKLISPTIGSTQV